MRAVNLLPPSERPRQIAAVPERASIAVIAVLALLVVGVAGWVLTKNQASGLRADIATANQEKDAATARAQGLKAFGDFSQVKQTRVKSISELATERFDWERFMRELALVLPAKVWVSDITAGGTAGDASSATSSSATATPAAGGAARSIGIKGCASSQEGVAQAMVRLRTLHGAEDVNLKDSSRPDAAAGAATAPQSDSSGGGGCGRYYQFTADVSFAAPEAAASGNDTPAKTPSRLGGGA